MVVTTLSTVMPPPPCDKKLGIAERAYRPNAKKWKSQNIYL